MGLDVDDVLYECNAFALARLNEKEKPETPFTIYDIHGWGKEEKEGVDRRVRYFSDPDFVASQPLFPGAQKFVQKLAAVADVFFVSAVPPSCMSARAMRLAADFPFVPTDNILLGTRKDLVKLDILLDDGAHNITHTPAAYPVLFRRPWNAHLSGLLSVNDYADFLHLVDMIRHSFTEGAPRLAGGGVICLVGPTGSGKNDVARELTKREGFARPFCATTRPKREGEAREYRFLEEKTFIRRAEAGEFLETTVYSGYHFGTPREELQGIVDRGELAVIPIDICGALTVKNLYRSRAVLIFLKRRRENILYEIISRDIDARDKTCRILSLDDEYRGEELCDLTVLADRPAREVAAEIENLCIKK